MAVSLLDDIRAAEAAARPLRRAADAAAARADDAEAVCARLRRRGTAGISIRSLPDGVLTDVFLALPMKDLARAGQASKAWRDARWSDGLWKARGAAAVAQRCELCCVLVQPWSKHLRVCCLKVCCSDCCHRYSDMELRGVPMPILPFKRHVPCPFCKTPAAKSDDELVARLQSHVDKGNPEAMLLLGEWYEAGDYGIESTERAEELWELGASLGHSASAWQLACMWDERIESGESARSANALKYMKMAADAGNSEAQAEMAYFLIAGFRDNGQMPYVDHAIHYLKNHDADSCTGEDGFLEAARYLRLVFEKNKFDSGNMTRRRLKSLVDLYRERGIDVLTDPPTRNLPRS
jgi:hypothetical protein